MPLGSAIGSGQGIHTKEEVRIIIEQSQRAGGGGRRSGCPFRCFTSPRDGCRRSIGEHCHRPGQRPGAHGRGFQGRRGSSRKAYLAGRIAVREYAAASSPTHRCSPACRHWGLAETGRIAMPAPMEVPCLCLVADASVVSTDELAQRVSAAVSGGVGLVQIPPRSFLGATAFVDVGVESGHRRAALPLLSTNGLTWPLPPLPMACSWVRKLYPWRSTQTPLRRRHYRAVGAFGGRRRQGGSSRSRRSGGRHYVLHRLAPWR